jgi:hypothetical protein
MSKISALPIFRMRSVQRTHRLSLDGQLAMCTYATPDLSAWHLQKWNKQGVAQPERQPSTAAETWAWHHPCKLRSPNCQMPLLPAFPQAEILGNRNQHKPARPIHITRIKNLFKNIFICKEKPWVRICRMSQEECARLREGASYGKVYRYNPKHLCPKLNGYRDNGQRKVWFSGGSTHYTYQLILSYLINVCPWVWCGVMSVLASHVSWI